MKHTPGPWTCQLVTDGGRNLADDVIQPTYAINCRGHAWPIVLRSEAHANARVIAAAPELLAALKAAVETIRIWHGFGHTTDEAEVWALYQSSPEMKLIAAAIAKAEGR